MTTQTTAWAHLPNAKHIDWVLDSLHREPDKWSAARDAARNAARDAAWDAALDAARDAAWDAALDAAWGAARAAPRAAWDAVSALIAWDDSADVLCMPADAVKLLSECGDQRARLLYPACTVRQNI